MPHSHYSRLRSVRMVDVDVGGDIHRIVMGGVRPCPGRTVRDRMHYLEHRADGLRRLLISEPFGNDSMCVDLVMPASIPEAEMGFVIMEVMGYPYYSGSNTVATATAILETGLIPMREGMQTLLLETPGGVATVLAENRDGHVQKVTTQGGAAFIQAAEQVVEVPGFGPVQYDLAWSGGYYVLVEADSVGHVIDTDNLDAMLCTADAIIRAVQVQFLHQHPELGEVGLPRFLHFMGPLETDADGSLHSLSATYGHPGVIWRCPTGTGTSARLALLHSRRQVATGAELRTVSPYAQSFLGRITGETRVGDYAAVESTITARPNVTAFLDLTVNLDAPWVRDYGLEDILMEPGAAWIATPAPP
ncbi:MAG: proline racemase family protein [Ectothiorhodospiraceae bacterium]|nr:proline racemase family protein [Ectothiorhodospiraceae bacterium]